MAIPPRNSFHMHFPNFDPLKNDDEMVTFADKYKQFKKEGNLHDVKEVISDTEKIMKEKLTTDELGQIKEGLSILKDKYEVIVREDRPLLTLARKFFPSLFVKRDQREKLTLDRMISELDNKIHSTDTVSELVEKYFDLEAWENSSKNSNRGTKILDLKNDADFQNEVVYTITEMLENKPVGAPVQKLREITSRLNIIINKYQHEKKSNIDLELPDIAEAILASLREDDLGVGLERLPGFITLLNEVLSEVDSKKVEIQSELVEAWMEALLPKIMTLTHIDLTKEYQTEGRTAIPVNYSHFVRDNVQKTKTRIKKNAGSLKSQEADTFHEKWIHRKTHNRTFRGQANRFLDNVSRLSGKDPREEANMMKEELAKFMEKVGEPNRHPALEAAMLVVTNGKRLASLAIKVQGLIENDPSLLDDPDFRAFRESLDFCCGVDPIALSRKGPSENPKAIDDDFIELLRKDLSSGFEGEHGEIDKLVDNPSFQLDAKKLFRTFLSENDWRGSISKSERFGSQFQELIINEYAGHAELTPKEKEAYMLATVFAARKSAPEVFLKLKGMDLSGSLADLSPNPGIGFYPANSAHDITFAMQRIGKMIEEKTYSSEANEKMYATRILSRLDAMRIEHEENRYTNSGKIQQLLNDPDFAEDAKALFEDFLQQDPFGDTHALMQRFGEQFHEIISEKYAPKLNIAEVRQVDEMLLLEACSLAAKELIPGTASRLGILDKKRGALPSTSEEFTMSNLSYLITQTIMSNE